MWEGKTTQRHPCHQWKWDTARKKVRERYGHWGTTWCGKMGEKTAYGRRMGKIPKTKNVWFPLEVMFCLMSVNLELLLTCHCFQGVSKGLSARSYNYRLLTSESGLKGLIQFQTAHFENQWLSNLSMHQNHKEGLSKGLSKYWEFLLLTSCQVILSAVSPGTTPLRTTGIK